MEPLTAADRRLESGAAASCSTVRSVGVIDGSRRQQASSKSPPRVGAYHHDTRHAPTVHAGISITGKARPVAEDLPKAASVDTLRSLLRTALASPSSYHPPEPLYVAYGRDDMITMSNMETILNLESLFSLSQLGYAL
ncbi:hypothetical protein AB5N19_10807 [Seiridium cardinale]|uniref:Uncharacterized protein n=1 Tax=Seiridium cardinale TaxID=138064 RepID=A0ABR2XMF6_9PEZI